MSERERRRDENMSLSSRWSGAQLTPELVREAIIEEGLAIRERLAAERERQRRLARELAVSTPEG